MSATQENPEPLKLVAPPTGLLSLEQAARSCGITRQAFHAWRVKPTARQGATKLFTLSDILENRIQAATEGETLDERDLARLAARKALLTEQLESLRLRLAEAARTLCTRTNGIEILGLYGHAVADILEGIDDDILANHPRTRPLADQITAKVQAAGAAWRRLPERVED